MIFERLANPAMVDQGKLRKIKQQVTSLPLGPSMGGYSDRVSIIPQSPIRQSPTLDIDEPATTAHLFPSNERSDHMASLFDQALNIASPTRPPSESPAMPSPPAFPSESPAMPSPPAQRATTPHVPGFMHPGWNPPTPFDTVPSPSRPTWASPAQPTWASPAQPTWASPAHHAAPQQSPLAHHTAPRWAAEQVPLPTASSPGTYAPPARQAPQEAPTKQQETHWRSEFDRIQQSIYGQQQQQTQYQATADVGGTSFAALLRKVRDQQQDVRTVGPMRSRSQSVIVGGDPEYSQKRELLIRIDNMKALGFSFPASVDYSSLPLADLEAEISRREVSMNTISDVNYIIEWIVTISEWIERINQLLGPFLPMPDYKQKVGERVRTPRFRYAIYQLILRYKRRSTGSPWKEVLMVLLLPLVEGIIIKVLQYVAQNRGLGSPSTVGTVARGLLRGLTNRFTDGTKKVPHVPGVTEAPPVTTQPSSVPAADGFDPTLVKSFASEPSVASTTATGERKRPRMRRPGGSTRQNPDVPIDGVMVTGSQLSEVN